MNPDATPHEVLQHLMSLGAPDPAAIERLRAWLEDDWVIDRDEADLMFRINAAFSAPSEAWIDLFTHTIVRFAVMDMSTPGELDEEEASWLKSHLTEKPGEAELRLREELRSHAAKIHPSIEALL